jgi:hypothetical protein
MKTNILHVSQFLEPNLSPWAIDLQHAGHQQQPQGPATVVAATLVQPPHDVFMLQCIVPHSVLLLTRSSTLQQPAEHLVTTFEVRDRLHGLCVVAQC